MEVILLEKIRNLGKVGDKVSVRGGFGRNYLLPQGKAIRASLQNLQEFETRRAELEAKAQALLNSATQRAATFENKIFKVVAKASEEGKLFGSVGTREIADAILAQGIELEKSEVRLPTGALRYLGEYDVELQLHSDLITMIKIQIVNE